MTDATPQKAPCESIVLTGTIVEDRETLRVPGQGHCTMEIDEPYPHSVQIVIDEPDNRKLSAFLNSIVDGKKVTVVVTLDRFRELHATLNGIQPSHSA